MIMHVLKWINDNWRQMIKAYGIVAFVHVFWKLLRVTRRYVRMQKVIGKLPGPPIDITSSDILKNLHRLHHYREEQLCGHRGAPLVQTSNFEIEVVCNTPVTVKTLLKDSFEDITKPGGEEDHLFHVLAEFIGGEGIFTLRHGNSIPDQNAIWYDQRKISSKIFTRGNFNNLMYGTFASKANILINNLKLVAEKNASCQENGVVDIQEKFFCFTFDSIQKIFFGRDVDSVADKEDPYAQAFDGAHRAMMRYHLASIPPNVAANLAPYPFGRLYAGARGWLTNPLFNIWRVMDPDYQDFQKHVAFLDRETEKLISLTRSDPNCSKRGDLLANFLKSDPTISNKRLRDVILNFIIAGRDTTACTLTWLFFELTQNQNVQKRLHEEIDATFQGRQPLLEDLTADGLPYLNGVFMEALRLHPPVPENLKFNQQDIVFPNGTTIPKGTRLVYSPYVMGRDETVYEDPLQFNPDRWIPFKQPTMFEFPVFQAGNRFCLGKDMATFETKFLVVKLLQQFSFELGPSEDPSHFIYALSITSSLCNSLDQTSHNLWIIPTLRNDIFGLPK